MTLNISKYDEPSKTIACSNSLGDQCSWRPIIQEAVQELYRIECKLLNYIDDHGTDGDYLCSLRSLSISGISGISKGKRKTTASEVVNDLKRINRGMHILILFMHVYMHISKHASNYNYRRKAA